MSNLNRRYLSLGLMTALAACGRSGSSNRTGDVPEFKHYFGPPVTQVMVQKAQRRMHLLNGQTVLKSYDFGLGNQPVGHKQFEGDGKTPEGLYFVDRFNPRSRYHLSVGISYPNEQDMARAQDDFADLAAFAILCESGSFTRAAERLGCSKGQLSKRTWVS